MSYVPLETLYQRKKGTGVQPSIARDFANFPNRTIERIAHPPLHRNNFPLPPGASQEGFSLVSSQEAPLPASVPLDILPYLFYHILVFIFLSPGGKRLIIILFTHISLISASGGSSLPPHTADAALPKVLDIRSFLC